MEREAQMQPASRRRSQTALDFLKGCSKSGRFWQQLMSNRDVSKWVEKAMVTEVGAKHHSWNSGLVSRAVPRSMTCVVHISWILASLSSLSVSQVSGDGDGDLAQILIAIRAAVQRKGKKRPLVSDPPPSAWPQKVRRRLRFKQGGSIGKHVCHIQYNIIYHISYNRWKFRS